MSFRPRFPVEFNSFPPPSHSNNNINLSPNPNFVCNSNTNAFQTSTQNNFRNCSNMNPNPMFISNTFPPAMHAINKSNNLYNNTFVPGQQPVNAAPFCPPNFVNTGPSGLLNPASQFSNVNAPYNQHSSSHLADQTLNKNPIVPFNVNSGNAYFDNDQRNISSQNFSYPVSNAVTNKVFASDNINNPASQPGNHTRTVISASVINSPQTPSSKLQNDGLVPVALQMLKNDVLGSCSSNMYNPLAYDMERKLSEFLEKFSITKKKNENRVMVPEFRYAVKAAIYMLKRLQEKKNKLRDLLNTEENEWRSEMQSVCDLKKELTTMCSFISAPVYLNSLIHKLKLIKKRRERKKKTKQNKFSEKIKAEQNRKELNQEIDKWLDDIKEKNLKLKREVEMKKEADFILLEVRRKIHEANKTIEKIKVFEKLRNARQANAVQKGLHILPEHNDKFEKKMFILKETMLKQLTDYEAEEKALKVMLETEQEGQLEEEAQWKIKKVKSLQQKRQNHIKECLFGVSDDPLPTDAMYLFHKYHTSANNSIENLIQIRHQWDMYLDKDGETVPRKWVVPVAPKNASWEQFLSTT